MKAENKRLGHDFSDEEAGTSTPTAKRRRLRRKICPSHAADVPAWDFAPDPRLMKAWSHRGLLCEIAHLQDLAPSECLMGIPTGFCKSNDPFVSRPKLKSRSRSLLFKRGSF